MGSLWAGCDPGYVANRDYTAEGPGDWGRSAEPAGHLQKDEDELGQTGDHEGILGYFDDRGGPLPHGWLVMQKSLAWPDEPFDDFVLLTYRFRNVSEMPLAGLYLGLFCDWDVANPFSNNGGVDPERNLAYLWSDPGHPYVGICLLTPAAPANLAFIHNPTYLHPTDFITDADKYGFLEGSLGVEATPAAADWSMIVSAGPFDLPLGGTADVCFAVLAGTNLVDLQANADAARDKFDQLLTGVGEPVTPLPASLLLEPNVPNPFNPATEIRYSLPRAGHVRVDVYDLMGRKVVTLFDGEQPAGPQSLTWRAQGVSSGTYLALVRTGGETAARKMLLLK